MLEYYKDIHNNSSVILYLKQKGINTLLSITRDPDAKRCKKT